MLVCKVTAPPLTSAAVPIAKYAATFYLTTATAQPAFKLIETDTNESGCLALRLPDKYCLRLHCSNQMCTLRQKMFS